MWLGHGSTRFEEGEFRPRPPEEVAKLVAWCRQALKAVLTAEPTLGLPMKLEGQDLGDAYERSGLLAKWYAADDMPGDEQLLNDAVTFAGYLKLVYDAEVLGLAPTGPPPEVIEVERAASGQPQRRGKAQGFGLSVAERLRDVSATHPYDFECTEGDKKMIVEVKGSTSTGNEIVITRNEVEMQRARHPNNALIVVHSINLLRSSGPPKAQGGELLMFSPWKIEDSQLRPIAFRCDVLKAMG